MTLWLMIVWVALWGELNWLNIGGGLALALAIPWLMPMPAVRFGGRLRLGRLVVLLGCFARDVVSASLQVAWLAIRPRGRGGRLVREGVVAVPLRTNVDLFITLTAQLCSLVPGTLILDVRRKDPVLYMHVLDMAQAGGAVRVREHTRAVEARVLWALASGAQLAAAGLACETKEGTT